ncbi:DNA recombination protein RmuC [Castellaniella caeni]|uniref:DNA recombination protein RmuC n=1 Tax=Castellaniella caeni TaxID=266123 RepID=UPI001E496197|nr:DNA recombination protein RmuC [Castellaniella caeni]
MSLTPEFLIGLLLAACLGALLAWWPMRLRQAAHAAALERSAAALAQQEADYARLLAEHTQQAQVLAQRAAELNQSMAGLAQQTERTAQLQARLDALQRALDDQAQRAHELRSAKDGAERERVRLDTLQAALARQAQALQTELADARQALDAARAQAQARDLELTELKAVHQEKLAAIDELKRAFEQSKAAMRTEFQNLANQVLEEKGKAFSQSSQASLDGLLRPFREQIEGFQKRVNEVHDASLRGQTQLGAEIRRVLDIGLKMSAEANTLATALKGEKKTTGNWGEVQLERSLQLAGLVAGDHYEAQASFKDETGNRRQPDFVVKLPDDKHMVIDSKVSLVDYDRAIAAQTDAEREAALAAHVQAVRHHIDDLARKDYSNLVGMKSPSFVLMFMPIEPAYIEAMKHNRDLFDYGYQQNVIMVSHTTLMPILRTVANLWMIARANEQTRALSDMAGGLYNQVALVAERLQKLGNTLNTVNTHYNSAVTAVAGQQGLYGKVGRFAELSAKANKQLPALEPMHADIEVQRLAVAAAETSDDTPDDGAQPSSRGVPTPAGAA